MLHKSHIFTFSLISHFTNLKSYGSSLVLGSFRSTSVIKTHNKAQVNFVIAALDASRSVYFVLWLTDGGNVCDHEVASLWHDGLQTHTLQAGGQLLPLVVQQGGQLLEVALWTPKHLVLSLKALSHCLLLNTRGEGCTQSLYTQHPLNTLHKFCIVPGELGGGFFRVQVLWVSNPWGEGVIASNHESSRLRPSAPSCCAWRGHVTQPHSLIHTDSFKEVDSYPVDVWRFVSLVFSMNCGLSFPVVILLVVLVLYRERSCSSL